MNISHASIITSILSDLAVQLNIKQNSSKILETQVLSNSDSATIDISEVTATFGFLLSKMHIRGTFIKFG